MSLEKGVMSEEETGDRVLIIGLILGVCFGSLTSILIDQPHGLIFMLVSIVGGAIGTMLAACMFHGHLAIKKFVLS